MQVQRRWVGSMVFVPDNTTFGVTAAAVSKSLRMEKRFPM